MLAAPYARCNIRPPAVKLLATISVFLGLITSGFTDVRLPAFFSDHMVLQRDRPVKVWGWAAAGEKVGVRIANRTGTATASASGNWQVTLPSLYVSSVPLTLTVTGKTKIEVKDVLVGDVWLCGGQSNMEFGLGGCDAPEDIATADLPLVRQFGVEYNFASRPQTDVGGRWSVCSPQTAPGFSAVAFYFARKVHSETGVPIGLMRSCVGGTNIELWMSQQTLLTTPSLEPFARQMRESLAQYQTDLAKALPALDQWSARAKASVKAKTEIPLPPDLPPFPFGEQAHRPRCVTLHNGMIAPLQGLCFRGVIWYQGENNAGSAIDGAQYIEKMRAMIHDWRAWFGDPKLPFYYVQLASWLAPNPDPAGGDGWAVFRDFQRQAMTIPFTGMASAIDVGDDNDIHPKNKFDVGERLALWALRNEYGKPVEVSGPLFRDLTIEGNQVKVRFAHVGRGLMAGIKKGRAPATTAPSQTVGGYAVAGEDRVWHWATATIVGDDVICSSPEVSRPVAVRYGFSMNPKGANLYNRDGLPASPFRTDNW